MRQEQERKGRHSGHFWNAPQRPSAFLSFYLE